VRRVDKRRPEPPHQIAFKCTPEAFAELVEQPGLIPAPYMARAMWVQEPELGTALSRRDREALVRTSYELVSAKLPRRRSKANSPARRAKGRQPHRPRKYFALTQNKIIVRLSRESRFRGRRMLSVST
jgi:hypothetical protein